MSRVGVGSFLKFLYAIIWQEQIIDATKYTILTKPWFNALGAKLMPDLLQLADWLTGFPSTDSSVRHCAADVYPGAGWCRSRIPHAKWHELTGNAFVDLISLGEHLGRLYNTSGLGRAAQKVPDSEQMQAFEAVLGNLSEWANGVVEGELGLNALDAVGDSIGWLVSRWAVDDDSRQKIRLSLVNIQKGLERAVGQHAADLSAKPDDRMVLRFMQGAQALATHVLDHLK